MNRRQEVNFWVLYAFIIMFVASRCFVILFPEINIIVNGNHIHHFAYGFILLAIAGLMGLNNVHKTKPRFVAILFGIGLGAAVDEFGMWIRLEDNYWVRESYDAMIVVTSFLISEVYFGSFWRKIIAWIVYRFFGVRIFAHKPFAKRSLPADRV